MPLRARQPGCSCCTTPDCTIQDGYHPGGGSAAYDALSGTYSQIGSTEAIEQTSTDGSVVMDARATQDLHAFEFAIGDQSGHEIFDDETIYIGFRNPTTSEQIRVKFWGVQISATQFQGHAQIQEVDEYGTPSDIGSQIDGVVNSSHTGLSRTDPGGMKLIGVLHIDDTYGTIAFQAVFRTASKTFSTIKCAGVSVTSLDVREAFVLIEDGDNSTSGGVSVDGVYHDCTCAVGSAAHIVGVKPPVVGFDVAVSGISNGSSPWPAKCPGYVNATHVVPNQSFFNPNALNSCQGSVTSTAGTPCGGVTSDLSVSYSIAYDSGTNATTITITMIAQFYNASPLLDVVTTGYFKKTYSGKKDFRALSGETVPYDSQSDPYGNDGTITWSTATVSITANP